MAAARTTRPSDGDAQPRGRPTVRALRAVAPLVLDAGSWCAGLATAVLARFEFDTLTLPYRGLAVIALFAMLLHGVIGHAQFLYRGRYTFGSFHEVRAVSATVALTVGILVLIDLVLPHQPVPVSAPVVGGAFA